jgi:ATP-dependent DNA ligase
VLKSFEFCIPTMVRNVPSSPEWLHEIKYDGYRPRVERTASAVRLITHGRRDWPTALKSKAASRS